MTDHDCGCPDDKPSVQREETPQERLEKVRDREVEEREFTGAVDLDDEEATAG